MDGGKKIENIHSAQSFITDLVKFKWKVKKAFDIVDQVGVNY